MRAAARFFFVLSPSPLLTHRCCPTLLRLSRHHYHHHHQRCRLSPSLPALSSTTQPSPPGPTAKRLLPIKSSSCQLHTQTQSSAALPYAPAPPVAHAWPEFHALLDILSACGYFNRPISDEEYAAGANLSEDFLRASSACLSFARERPNMLGMVSRRDLEVVVENGTPFLFINGDDSIKRMKSFLENDVLDFYKANTVDLMTFLLSYASDFSAALEIKNLCNKELVESSVRNLLGELAKLSYSTPESNPSGSLQNPFSDIYGQTPRPDVKNIEMKRGDWNCPRCNFMNFARNVKCLECGEARPKRQLTGGEWECPQCDFFNYARNRVCLRCDCKRPGEVSFATANSRSVPGYGYGGSANKDDIKSRLAANEEKAQQWFSKVSQLDSTSDLSSGIADEDFPEIMPLRKGVNRFVVSTRKTPLERRLANAQYTRNLDNDGIPGGNDPQIGGVDNMLGTKVSQSLDNILGHSTTYQNDRADSSPPISSSGSSQYRNPRGSNSGYVPFVPIPADMFAKKPENAQLDQRMYAVSENYQSVDSKTGDQTGAITGAIDCNNFEDDLQLSEKRLNHVIQDKQNERADKSERWFKRVSELDNVTDLASEISDEDFPGIMPMRKGENRFVVNKKKDRSLTSPMYKRRAAMEQASNTNFVPFVPFPPDYFAKKDKLESAASTTEAAGETSNSVMPGKLDDARPVVPNMGGVQQMQNQQLGSGSWNSKPAGENSYGMKTGTAYGTSTSENSTQRINNSLSTSNDNWNGLNSGKVKTDRLVGSSSELVPENQSSRYSGKEMKSLSGISPRPAENENIRNSWTGKSLEGSAVKEPDPLDMSEEAKAERWFRRVAQIKDISELSQIPDEDFPSIMPMRKGVNRFVVSKRKTPLERRLTSQQYRKNLPIVSSDLVKKESDSG